LGAVGFPQFEKLRKLAFNTIEARGEAGGDLTEASAAMVAAIEGF